MNSTMTNGIIVKGNQVILSDGTRLPPCPAKGRSTTVINNKVFIDGYEFKNGKWRKTLKAIFYKLF